MDNVLRKSLLRLKQYPLTILVSFIWLVFFAQSWMYIFTQNERGMFVGHPFVWADWSMHIAHINWFAEQSPERWLKCQPTYACARFNYPFLTNLISGLLLRAESSLAFSILVPSIVFSTVGSLLLTKLYSLLLRKDVLIALALIIALASGGLGVFLAIGASLLHQPLEITNWTAFSQLPTVGIEFANIFLAMFLPQRSFLLGLGLALVALIAVWNTFISKSLTPVSWIAYTATMTILPLSHSHSFLAVGWITLFLAVWQTLQSQPNKRSTAERWLKFGMPALIFFGCTYYFFLQSSDISSSFVTIHVGWMAEPGFWNWLKFWILNWGTFGILAILGTVLLRKKSHACFPWVMAGWSLFALANVFQLQPQIWDNSKAFAWAYLILAPAAAFALLWIKNIRIIGGALAAFLFFFTIATGFTDLLRMQRIWSQPIEIFSSEQLQLAEFIRINTPPQSIFLTSEYPANPVTLAGRAIVMGYPGWAFSHGLPHSQRSADIQAMYQFPHVEPGLFSKYGIRYVLIGIHETSYQPNSAFFEQNFAAVFSNPAGTLYDLNTPR